MPISPAAVRFGTIVFEVKKNPDTSTMPVFSFPQVWRDDFPLRVVFRSRVPGNPDIVVLRNSRGARKMTTVCNNDPKKIDLSDFLKAVRRLQRDIFKSVPVSKNSPPGETKLEFKPAVFKRLPKEDSNGYFYGPFPTGPKRKGTLVQKVRSALDMALKILTKRVQNGEAGLSVTQETVHGKPVTVYYIDTLKTGSPTPKGKE